MLKKAVLYYDNASDYAKGIADEFKREYKGKIVTEATFLLQGTRTISQH